MGHSIMKDTLLSSDRSSLHLREQPISPSRGCPSCGADINHPHERDCPRISRGDGYAPVSARSAPERKAVPIVAGCLDYFPDALAAVAELSRIGNEQHNPGQPLHWERAKSGDEADALVRHLLDRGTVDTDGVRHSTKVAWRALALLQKELEAAGAPLARGARNG